MIANSLTHAARTNSPDRALWCATSVAVWLLGVVPPVSATEIVIYSFEESPEGWVIPDWAKNSADYVGEECAISQEHAQDGHASLEVRTAFPGGRWSGAYVERETEVTDWTPFGSLLIDLYLPDTAPTGLQGRLILTVGDQWQWTEMNHPVSLKPGAWTTVSVNLKPGSTDWKFFPDDHFRASVRKIGVRIESDKQPAYRGSVFLDNIRLAE